MAFRSFDRVSFFFAPWWLDLLNIVNKSFDKGMNSYTTLGKSLKYTETPITRLCREHCVCSSTTYSVLYATNTQQEALVVTTPVIVFVAVVHIQVVGVVDIDLSSTPPITALAKIAETAI